MKAYFKLLIFTYFVDEVQNVRTSLPQIIQILTALLSVIIEHVSNILLQTTSAKRKTKDVIFANHPVYGPKKFNFLLPACYFHIFW